MVVEFIHWILKNFSVAIIKTLIEWSVGEVLDLVDEHPYRTRTTWGKLADALSFPHLHYEGLLDLCCGYEERRTLLLELFCVSVFFVAEMVSTTDSKFVVSFI